MPLDGHAYLVSQGWQGKGSGLRHGSISRPVIIAQKKTMAGIGKDRDEAFPFWDHVFTTAASSIKIKVYDSDSEDTESPSPSTTFEKTRTGIISNRRPTVGTPALSGTATPCEALPSSNDAFLPRLSIMAAAKQQAARRALYSMFFRGPILGNDTEEPSLQIAQGDATLVTSKDIVSPSETLRTGQSKEGRKRKRETEAHTSGHKKGKGRAVDVVEDVERQLERKTKMKKRKTQTGEEGKHSKSEPLSVIGASDSNTAADEAARARKAEKAERKRLKAEKRARREEKRGIKELHGQETEATAIISSGTLTAEIVENGETDHAHSALGEAQLRTNSEKHVRKSRKKRKGEDSSLAAKHDI